MAHTSSTQIPLTKRTRSSTLLVNRRSTIYSTSIRDTTGEAFLTGYMQQHTYVVATLRHPMEQMRSGFNYYGFAKQVEMMGKHTKIS